MYHAEIREGPHLVRAFNLTADQVRTRLLAPLRAGAPFRYEDREWDPRRTRLTVYEAPELRPDQLGFGRGWPNAQKLGIDVTEQFRSAPAAAEARPAVADQLRERLIGRLTAGPVTMAEILALAAELMPASNAEQRLAASQAAAWELLARGEAQLAPSAR